MSDRPDIVGLHHVRVPVCDVLASRDWYVDVLGFSPMLVTEEEASVSGEALLHPSGLVVGLHVDPDAAHALEGFCVLGLGVDNLSAWVGYLDRNDISHGPVERGPRGMHVCISDPDGLVIELHTLAQPSTEDA
jgi:catechol 2,3-dioxygenase-like lactoylglutathione lyase family enzyme